MEYRNRCVSEAMGDCKLSCFVVNYFYFKSNYFFESPRDDCKGNNQTVHRHL